MGEKLTFWAVFVIYFGIMSLLRWDWSLAAVWWLAGGVLGMAFVFVDRLLYVFVTKPHEHLSEHVKHKFREGRYLQGLKLLNDRKDEQRKLTVRSVFFMGAWIPVAFFVITSTTSALATGFVMGIGLHMLYDVWVDWKQMEKLKSWLFWPVKRSIKDGEVKVVVGLFAVTFLVLSAILV